MRPVVLVDLDNVVYDFPKAMANWLVKNSVVDELPRELMRHYKTWEIWNDWGISKGEFHRWWRLGIEEGAIYATGPLVPGAREALWRLSDAEWDIHIATSRLTKFGLHDQIVINTAEWLRANNIPYRNLHFTDHKRSIVADAIVDDRLDNMSEDMHIDCFEFPANHNKGRFVTEAEQMAAWEHVTAELIA